MKKINSWFLPDNEEHLLKYIIKSDGYQKKQREHALSFVKKFNCCLDIGGHVGLWSRELAQKFTGVIAFEPIQVHRECFMQNVNMKNVTLYPFGLGEKETTAAFDFDGTNTGHTRISETKHGVIEIKILDSYNFKDINFIKIDCEGYEYFVLKGAEKTIKENRPIINIEQKRFLYKGIEQYSACKLLESYGMKFLSRCSDEFVYGW